MRHGQYQARIWVLAAIKIKHLIRPQNPPLNSLWTLNLYVFYIMQCNLYL